MDLEAIAAASSLTLAITAAAMTAVKVRQLKTRLADATRRYKAAEREAAHDGLTGLLNRSAFTQLASPLAQAGGVAAWMVDLNDFKTVNDTYGHGVGDLVLRAIAERLTGHLGCSETVACRLGGDEFAFVLPIGGRAVDTWPAAESRRLAQALKAPIDIAMDVSLSVTASIGVTVSTAPTVLGELLRQSDLAVYRAKGRRDHVAVYNALIDGPADRSRRPLLRTRDLAAGLTARLPVRPSHRIEAS